MIGERHYYTHIAVTCTLRPAFVSSIPTTFNTVAHGAITTISATRYRLWRLDRCGLVVCRYTQINEVMHLHRDTEQGRRAVREVTADMRRVKARALKALLVSSLVAKG